jgi:hypothetical protein
MHDRISGCWQQKTYLYTHRLINKWLAETEQCFCPELMVRRSWEKICTVNTVYININALCTWCTRICLHVYTFKSDLNVVYKNLSCISSILTPRKDAPWMLRWQCLRVLPFCLPLHFPSSLSWSSSVNQKRLSPAQVIIWLYYNYQYSCKWNG